MIGLIEFARKKGSKDKQKRRRRLETAVQWGGVGLGAGAIGPGLYKANQALKLPGGVARNKLARQAATLIGLSYLGSGASLAATGAKTARMQKAYMERLKRQKEQQQ